MKNLLEKLQNVPLWQKGAVVGVIVIAMIAAFYFMVYTKKDEQIRQLDAEIDELAQKISKAKEMQSKLAQFRKEFLLLQEDLKLLLDILPNEEEMDRLIIVTEGLATQSGLQILNFNPRPPVSKGFYGETPIQINVIGGYHDLGYFFEKVANESRIINIKNIKMKTIRVRGGKRRQQIRANFIASAFWFKE